MTRDFPQNDLNSLHGLIWHAMEEKKLTIRDLAKASAISYEHGRKIVRGEALPSRHLLLAVCDWLNLDREQALALAYRSRLSKRLPAEHAEESLEKLNALWVKLTGQQQEDLLHLATRWSGRNTQMKT